MSIRTTIDIPDELHAELRRRSAAGHTSIRKLITGAIERELRPVRAPATGPLVGKPGKPAPEAQIRRIHTTSYLPLTSVRVCPSWARHTHSKAAWNWFSEHENDNFFFSRLTQIGLLRLLATASIMGKDVQTIGQAWGVYGRVDGGSMGQHAA